jgi:autotransporter translocation and assembly factor TamB
MRKVLLFAVLLILGVVVGSAWWFLYTAQGARFFLDSLSRFAPVEITAGKVTGRLADRLELDNLQVRIPQDSISLSSAKASLSWGSFPAQSPSTSFVFTG